MTYALIHNDPSHKFNGGQLIQRIVAVSENKDSLTQFCIDNYKCNYFGPNPEVWWDCYYTIECTDIKILN